MNGFNLRRCLAGVVALAAITVTDASVVKGTVVYAMSNEQSLNRVFAWRLGNGGRLTSLGSVLTKGRGVGTYDTAFSGPADGIDPLGSQGALTLSPDGHWLFAVNAGDNTVSVFKVNSSGRLTLTDCQPSRGKDPVSVASHGQFVYVVNVNVPGSINPSTIMGYLFDETTGKLRMLKACYLSSPEARPSQISITPDGSTVVVTERESNTISFFPINGNGTLANPTTFPSVRSGPFGFGFTPGGALVVSESAPGETGGSSVSSYGLSPAGGLTTTVLSGGIMNGQTGSCWTTISPNGRNAYVTNFGSNTISTYGIDASGHLSLQQAAVPTGASPIDSGISADGSWFFQLLGQQGVIAIYSLTTASGNLGFVRFQSTNLPLRGVQGLAVSR